MGSKRKKNRTEKQKNTVIEQVNMQIDYEKLATAIVKATKEAEVQKSYISDVFAIIITIAFRVVSALGIVFGTAGGIILFAQFQEITSVTGIISLMSCCMFLVIIVLMSVLLWNAAKEIDREKDKYFVVAVFSAVVSVAALVVAFVALIK